MMYFLVVLIPGQFFIASLPKHDFHHSKGVSTLLTPFHTPTPQTPLVKKFIMSRSKQHKHKNGGNETTNNRFHSSFGTHLEKANTLSPQLLGTTLP